MVQHHPQQSCHLGHKSYIIYISTPCSDTPAWSKSSLSMGVPSESPALRRREGRLFKRATRWARAKLGPIKQHSRWCVHKQIYWLLTANPECDQAHAQQNKIAVTIWKGRVVSHLLKEKNWLVLVGWSKRLLIWHMCKPQKNGSHVARVDSKLQSYFQNMCFVFVDMGYNYPWQLSAQGTDWNKITLQLKHGLDHPQQSWKWNQITQQYPTPSMS